VDIPANVHELKQGAGDVKSAIAPQGSLQSINDVGVSGYQGPCPGVGEGDHRYLITVYALKTAKLGTTQASTAALTGYMLGKQLLTKASLMVYMKR
jgi:Raf kinase inhibitor-like YbhB/YbcL family protein